MSTEDTGKEPETVEPVAPSDPNATPQSGSDGATAQTNQGADAKALSEQLDAERKARQQAEMERNKLRNDAQEAERKRLEEESKYKELYETERERYARIEAEQETARLRSFREGVINSYADEKTREAAKKLIAKNDGAIVWQQGATEDQAKQQLQEQLDALRDVVSTPGATETGPESEDLNPGSSRPAKPAAADKSIKELEDELQKRMEGGGF